MKRQNGFTLIEMFIVFVFCVVIVFGFGFVGGIIMGNQWYTEDSVLKELKVEHPNVEHVISTERNLYAKSKILVQEGGERATYLLDSDVLWNYKFEKSKWDNDFLGNRQYFGGFSYINYKSKDSPK